MNQAAQQIPSNPALDFAEGILAETNNALELIEILREISEGIDEEATTNDRITATNILADRGLGKCPKQIPVLSPAEGANTDVGAIRESPSAVPHKEPESPRLVTQIDKTLNQSLGSVPSAHTPTRHSSDLSDSSENENDGSSAPFDPYSIHYIIQQHILGITNNGQTLRDTLLEIARAKDDPKVRPYHRRKAVTLLLDRVLGTNPALIRNGVCPSCRRKWTTHPGSPDHSEPSRVAGKTEEEPFDKEVWEGIIAELNQMEEDGTVTPDPDAPEVDMSAYMKWTDEEIEPYAAEAAAKLRADIKLRLERQKQWPEIEERRRKKLAKIYPSHTDGGPPDT